MSDHEDWYVDDGNSVGGAELPGDISEPKPGRIVIINQEVGDADNIESGNEEPKQRTSPDCQERSNSKNAGCKITPGGKLRER